MFSIMLWQDIVETQENFYHLPTGLLGPCKEYEVRSFYTALARASYF